MEPFEKSTRRGLARVRDALLEAVGIDDRTDKGSEDADRLLEAVYQSLEDVHNAVSDSRTAEDAERLRRLETTCRNFVGELDALPDRLRDVLAFVDLEEVRETVTKLYAAAEHEAARAPRIGRPPSPSSRARHLAVELVNWFDAFYVREPRDLDAEFWRRYRKFLEAALAAAASHGDRPSPSTLDRALRDFRKSYELIASRFPSVLEFDRSRQEERLEKRLRQK